MRHSSARRIRIELDYRSDSVVLRIADDGRGFAPEHVVPDADRHYGLVSMRERVNLVKGTMLVTSKPGWGTEISVGIPIDSRFGRRGRTPWSRGFRMRTPTICGFG